MVGSSNAEENQQDGNDYLYNALWRACAGPLVSIPCIDDKVFYFPQGHIEEIAAHSSRDGDRQLPNYDLPSKILCRVVNVELQAERDTDEVVAHVTLIPQSEDESTSERETVQVSAAPQQTVVSFCKILTASDTSTHGGFSVLKRHADECLPQLDMTQNPPAQELVAKDFHGTRWGFRHIYRGQPKRHLITTGWSTFVNSKKLAAGDAFILIRGENGELRVGVRRALKRQSLASLSVISAHSMQIGVLASARHAINTGTMFSVYYRPRTSPSEFIVSYDRYMESMKIDYLVGTKFRMKVEGRDGQEERYAGVIISVEDREPATWPDSKWKCLKVQWAERADKATGVQPERVSPWEIMPFSAATGSSSSTSRPKRQRAAHLPSRSESSSSQRDGSLMLSTELAARHDDVLQGQEKIARGLSFHVDSNETGNAHMRFHEQNQKGTEGPSCSRQHELHQENKAFKLFGVSIPANSVCSILPHSATSGEIQKPLTEKTMSASRCESGGSVSASGQSTSTDTIVTRSCIKVHKMETALGRSVDLSKFNGYRELIDELDKMFEFHGGLVDSSKGWKVIYTDAEGDIRIVGDFSWSDFLLSARKIYIYPEEEVEKLQSSSA
ncbi:uncharacterized protein A4U43_C07F14910 [Asparagus officinalis]|uniref:Auxin response factor n=1 Tax=Asparagus officinalis TaxID=4686 RepID=A0A5P1EC09_ASPOF|nr:auxin response factor 2-like isoform X2 [Asparagus officinalis]ONK63416.1 uncharacterized protein A4U43_C07F14910 [Asparagus officinalis]